jgi:hypothetical protein
VFEDRLGHDLPGQLVSGQSALAQFAQGTARAWRWLVA